MIEKECRRCGEPAVLVDTDWDEKSKRFVRLFHCDACGGSFKVSGQTNGKPRNVRQEEINELEMLKRINSRLEDLEGVEPEDPKEDSGVGDEEDTDE